MTTCEEGPWYDLMVAANKHSTAQIRVDRTALAALVRCNGGMPDELIHVTPRMDSGTILVNRDILLKMLKEHTCHAP